MSQITTGLVWLSGSYGEMGRRFLNLRLLRNRRLLGLTKVLLDLGFVDYPLFSYLARGLMGRLIVVPPRIAGHRGYGCRKPETTERM